MLIKRNLIFTYFQKMRKVQKESILEKGISLVSMEHLKRKLLKKSFKAWLVFANETKEQILKVMGLMKKKPVVMVTLMKFIGF